MDFQERDFAQSPRETAGFFSKLFFTWTLPLYKKGRKVKLGIDDLHRLAQTDASENLGDEFHLKWKINIEQSKKRGRKPSLISTLFSIYGLYYSLLIIPMLIEGCFMSVMQPICVRLFVKSFSDPSYNVNSYERYLYGAGIIVSAFYRTISVQVGNFKFFHMGMRIRVALSTAIYRKILRLSRKGQDAANIGHILNLFSNDLPRFDIALLTTPFFLVSPLALLLCSYILWTELGVAAFAGLGTVLLLTLLQYFFGSYCAVLRQKVAVRTDSRAKLMSEIIMAMRVIKMYAWEKPFASLIHVLRRSEMEAVTNRLYLRCTFLSVFMLSHRLILFVTMIVYMWTGEALTAEKVFFTSTVFTKVVHNTIMLLPNAFANYGEMCVAVRRIENFLLLEDDIVVRKKNKKPESDMAQKNDEKLSIHLENVVASWTAEKQTLSNISWSVTGPKLLMIVGEVGSGKTSMLDVLVGELTIQSGNCTIHGELSYASQEPWIFSGTVRQNIIFGKPYVEASYQAIIEACALGVDFKNWENGDFTRVGERGVSLSGGQKARINLARALYIDSTICVLDDILSAVDSKVSRHLFERCIMGLLRNRLRIFVTHQLQCLPYADHIIVMEDGCIQAQGTYADLLKQNIDLLGLLTAKTEVEAIKSVENSEESELNMEESDSGNPLASKRDGKESEEGMNAGKVSFRTYWKYFRTADSLCLMALIAVGFLVVASLSTFSDFWLAYWTNSEERLTQLNTEFLPNSSANASDMDSEFYLGFSTYVSVYSGSVLGTTFGSLAVALTFFGFGLKIGVNMHDRMFRSLVRAPIDFYDKNPSGRIMNRFTHDLGALDELLVVALYETMQICIQNMFILVLISILNPVMILPTLLVVSLLCIVRQHYIPTSRALKRIDAITRSPCLTHLTATYQGLPTIRALRAQPVLIQQFCAQLDVNSSAWYLLFSTARWFGIWLDLICLGYLTIVVFSFCLFSSAEGIGGSVGLAVTSALMMMSSFQWAIRQSTATESFMTSVERVLEYVSTPSEAPLESKPECKPRPDWPQEGQIIFDSVSLDFGGSPVLKNISFEIEPRQKIGIIGRTGAGKSSILSALFRMVEPSGNIYIDGVRVQDIGLHDLRQSISIIPQDPQLFGGTVRYNLDPFDRYEDSELWQAIEEVELKDAIPALDYMVSSGGSNFSVGQRQLVCLARAILRKNCILVSDEATASVDERTDALIQATIREKFEFCTIITIAHRLNTVMDCDKILVLHNGTVMEFDEPAKLLQNPNSYLALMLEQTEKENKEHVKA